MGGCNLFIRSRSHTFTSDVAHSPPKRKAPPNPTPKPKPPEDEAPEIKQIDDVGVRIPQHPKKSKDGVSPKPSVTSVESVDNTPASRTGNILNGRRSGVQVSSPICVDVKAELRSYPKTTEEVILIRKAIEGNDFLNKIISGKRLNDVIKAMYSKEVTEKQIIIKQGELGTHMFVSSSGQYKITIKGQGVVSEFDDVRVFGELAILYNAKRLASIKAVTDGKVWVLDRNVYQQIMVRHTVEEQDEILNFLLKTDKLKVIGEAGLREVAKLLKKEFFSAGTQIVRQGDKGDKFYIIRAGTVTITKNGEGVVGKLGKGHCFGELALQKEDSRQATITANAPAVDCLTITRQDFLAHFGDINITEIHAPSTTSIKEVEEEYSDTAFGDLKTITTIGVGGFGRVELVRHKKKKKLVFALKSIKKINVVLKNQQEHVYNEKNIQMSSRSPFIVRLYRTYKDRKYIYFLMESCLGGDLWSLLHEQKNKRFDDNEARFLAACVLESFDYLHSRGIIYRDLKPENLLIDTQGYIKLTDFGFAKKMNARGKTFTFAGTPEYVAPEIINNIGHDKAVDYWAFGILIFELLTGRTPFITNDSSHMETYKKIMSGIDSVKFPTYVNQRAKHLIRILCRPIPLERLGMQKNGINDIKNHKWFVGLEWEKFMKCKVPSPFKPKLKDLTDTRRFEKFPKDTDIPPDEVSGWDIGF